MNAAEYFGPKFFERAEPEPEYETFEQWAWRWVHGERIALERLVQESVRESAAAKPAGPEIPAMPDGVPVNASIAEAWRVFHSVPRTLRERSAPAPVRRRPGVRELHTLVADPDVRHLLP